MNSAVDWHSAIAADFDGKYRTNSDFIERAGIWADLIGCSITPGARVLDVGCGSGAISCLASPQASSVLGVDGSAEMVALAKARAASMGYENTHFKTSRLENCLELNGSYDLVLCSSVIEYMPGTWSFIERLIAATAPSGVLIASLPNIDAWYRIAERLAYRVSGKPSYLAYTHPTPGADAMQRGLHARGMETLDTKFYGVGIKPITFALRRIGLRRANDTMFAVAARRNGP